MREQLPDTTKISCWPFRSPASPLLTRDVHANPPFGGIEAVRPSPAAHAVGSDEGRPR